MQSAGHKRSTRPPGSSVRGEAAIGRWIAQGPLPMIQTPLCTDLPMRLGSLRGVGAVGSARLARLESTPSGSARLAQSGSGGAASAGAAQREQRQDSDSIRIGGRASPLTTQERFVDMRTVVV